jgi:hypothetical protein
MHMVVPGRRALGEDWRKVTIGVKDDKVGVTKNEPAEAPADGNPIFVPGLGNISTEMADFILESKRHDAEDRAKKPKRSQAEVNDEVNRLWHDFVEQKLRHFKGQSTFGPGVHTQRERSVDRHG